MASISQAERNAIIDGCLEISGRDYDIGSRFMRLLIARLPGIDWESILRTRAAIWQPYIDSGLVASSWCDEVMRLAAFG